MADSSAGQALDSLAQESPVAEVAQRVLSKGVGAASASLDSRVQMPAAQGGFPIATKIASFFREGFLSGDALKKVHEVLAPTGASIGVSADRDLVSGVSLNFIRGKDGILDSLFAASKGGFNVMIEEKVELEGGIFKDLQIRKGEEIAAEQAKLASSLPAFMSVYALPAALQQVGEADDIFRETLEAKFKHTALFVLDLTQINAQDVKQIPESSVCVEFRSSRIPAESIKYVIVHEDFREEISQEKQIPHEKIRYVRTVQARGDVLFVASEHGNYKTIKMKKMNVPNYQEELEVLCAGQGSRPLATHMTRL